MLCRLRCEPKSLRKKRSSAPAERNSNSNSRLPLLPLKQQVTKVKLRRLVKISRSPRVPLLQELQPLLRAQLLVLVV
jgi:hypothetical protein